MTDFCLNKIIYFNRVQIKERLFYGRPIFIIYFFSFGSFSIQKETVYSSFMRHSYFDHFNVFLSCHYRYKYKFIEYYGKKFKCIHFNHTKCGNVSRLWSAIPVA